ncbi:endoglucanase [Elysia marginata]|uniref:Endoglucanase n=1 Tax=Elysia marginata TaxID=1093978 RepID=A0AAV4IXJ9_9GAST|nr:endoglucanase [Elysia marginata]
MFNVTSSHNTSSTAALRFAMQPRWDRQENPPRFGVTRHLSYQGFHWEANKHGKPRAGDFTPTGTVKAFDFTRTGTVKAFDFTPTGTVKAFDFTRTGTVKAFDFTRTGTVKALPFPTPTRTLNLHW